jgi:hypothetical protein
MVCPAAQHLNPLPFPVPYVKSSLAILLYTTLLTSLAVADLPQKPPINRYSRLWTDSPFTSKPPPATAGPQVNPLNDFALIGISPIGGNNYRVTMINKKKPDERVMVDSNSNKEYKILGVTRKTGDPLGTVVRMSYNSMVGTVTFDEKLLTLTPAPVAAPPAPAVQPGQPVPNPAQAEQPQPQRQPRPRVVPPPQVQQGQPAQQNNGRADRRRN